jgi:hypothetical protein
MSITGQNEGEIHSPRFTHEFALGIALTRSHLAAEIREGQRLLETVQAGQVEAVVAWGYLEMVPELHLGLVEVAPGAHHQGLWG